MFTDTHSHINCIVKNQFDIQLSAENKEAAARIVHEAALFQVTTIINVGTSFIESKNCIELAQLPGCYAIIGIHPNDCGPNWADEIKQMRRQWLQSREQIQAQRIIGIGECGIDRYYTSEHLQRQYDAFRAQIELALEYDLALSIHSRDAADETLAILEEYKTESLRGIIHCFSYDQSFANEVISRGFVLGIGGTLTYPKNEILRHVASTVPLEAIVLETDAPFLPPQSLRGTKNHPKNIPLIAKALADLRQEPLENVAHTIEKTVKRLFRINLP